MKDAILALGMGGPDSSASVEPFLKNLLSDRDIINFGIGEKLQKFIAARIAASRAKKTIPKYNLMGGGSPQLSLTFEMLREAAVYYQMKKGVQLDIYAGMCYWHPYIEEAVKQIGNEDYKNIYLFPLYPQYSTTTSGVCFARLNNAVQLNPPKGKMIRISSYYDFEGYINAIASRVNEAIEISGFTQYHLLYSAHSLPQQVVDKGDPYVSQVKKTVDLINEIIKPDSFSIAYQSKIGRMKWISPDLHSELLNLCKQGVQNIILNPVSFINDHIETLVELDAEIIPFFRTKGMNIIRTGSLNVSLAEAVADMLIRS